MFVKFSLNFVENRMFTTQNYAIKFTQSRNLWSGRNSYQKCHTSYLISDNDNLKINCMETKEQTDKIIDY